jgi:hypothetical protein
MASDLEISLLYAFVVCPSQGGRAPLIMKRVRLVGHIKSNMPALRFLSLLTRPTRSYEQVARVGTSSAAWKDVFWKESRESMHCVQSARTDRRQSRRAIYVRCWNEIECGERGESH